MPRTGDRRGCAAPEACPTVNLSHKTKGEIIAEQPDRNWPLLYQECFASNSGQAVLEHLERFCKAAVVLEPLDETGRIDPYKVMHYNGQRSVYVMICRMLAGNIHEQKQEYADNE